MSRTKIPVGDVVIDLVAPTDVINDNPLDNTTDGATCSFKAFDADKSEALTQVENGGSTIWNVSNVGVFIVGDLVEIILDSGSRESKSISSIDTVAGTMTMGSGIASIASIGNLVRKKFTNAITMDEYGTPALGTRDWGFRGTLPGDTAGFMDGTNIDVEILFIGAVGGGLDRTFVLCLEIDAGCDC